MTMPSQRRCGLLVSVRSAAEAEIAIRGGADLIDVKEPRRGSLGRADDAVISEVIQQVDGRRHISAAMGELADEDKRPVVKHPVQFLKWGLANCRGTIDWQVSLRQFELIVRLSTTRSRVVFVGYGDWVSADAPSVDEVVSFACERAGSVLLLDTNQKDTKQSLLDHVPISRIAHICQTCHAAGVRIALAGSLNLVDITRLIEFQPDWIAVRGAVCTGARDGAICQHKVRAISQLINAQMII